MKRKVLNILFALVLVLGMSLVMAAPAAAATAATSVWVSFAAGGNALNTHAAYTIYFTPTTALKRGIDTITVAFPDGIDTTMGTYTFVLSSAQTTATYYTFGADALVATSAATLWNTSYQRVNITTPVDMAAGTAAYFVITAAADIHTAATAGTFHIKLWTSKDTTPVLSSAFPVDGSVVSEIAAYAAPSSLVAGAASDYYFSFTSATAVTTADTITVEFPLLTYLPPTIAATAVYAGDTAGGSGLPATLVTVDTTQRTVTVTPGAGLGASTLNYVYFTSGAGILNPTTAGDKQIFIWTSTDGQKVASATNIYAIVAGTATKLAFKATTSDDATIINAFTGALKLEAQDVNGNIKLTDSTTTVLVSVTTGGTVHTAAGASGNLWGTSQALTSGAIDVFYRPTTAGTHVLTATVVVGTAMTAGTWTVYVAPAVVLKDASGTTINSYSLASGLYTAGLYGGAYIQAAINAASAGDTVELGSGIYEFSTAINLNKKITLKATTGTSPILRNTATITKAIDVLTDGSATQPIVIDGLTFQRLVLGTEIRIAIYNNGYDYVTVQNCTFNYIEPNASTTTQAVVWFGIGDVITSATVSNNTFNSCVTTWPDMGGGAKSGSIVFSVGFGGSGSFSGVTISGNTLTNCSQYGIAISGNAAHVASTTTISNNTITNGYSSIDLAGDMATATVTGNTITGAYSYGIKVEGLVNTAVTIKTNSITGTAGTGAAIQIVEENTPGAVTIQYNDLYNNNGYAIQTAYAFNCEYNWYGSASGPGLLLVLGSTDTTPWLHVSKATVVTANAAYIAQSVTLGVGIHTLSTPALLITTADQISELMPSYATNMAYCYKVVDGAFVNIGTGVLEPCSAYYIKMTVADTIVLKYAANLLSTPTKALTAGWNLIGLASFNSMDSPYAVVSVLKTAAGLPGYSQVISPSMNTASWSYSVGEAAASMYMYPTEGYWIYMQNASTLAGFTIFPLVPDLD